MRSVVKVAVVASLLAGTLLTTQLTPDAIPPPTLTAIQSPIQPQFDFAWSRNRLSLSGHTISKQHENDLIDVATDVFQAAQVDANFQPMAIVPAHWQDSTVQTLYALARSASARAELTPGHLNIRAVTDDEIGWNTRLAALRASLPAAIAVSDKTMLVAADIDAQTVCKKAFASFEVSRINFEESSARFLSSAYPPLARVAGLANACLQSSITITGHTDTSGNEASNRSLSLRRANAVAAHLRQQGVDVARLSVAGAGSSEPIATNRSRYGRSLNRRIEINFDAITLTP